MNFVPDHPETLNSGITETRENLLLSAWLTREIPPRDYLLGSVICTTSRWLIFGDTGVGKSLIACAIGAAIASGRPFLEWGGRRPARVMYLDGEMPAETFKERMQLLADLYGSDIAFYGYNRDDLGDGQMPPLNLEDGEKWLKKEIGAVMPDFIIFDSIMSLLTGVMSEEESWEPVKRLARWITSLRIGQLWIHHTGHDSTKGFGTKTREWEMDTVLRLAFASEDRDGPITMDFRKTRLRTPENAAQFKPLTITLSKDGWTADVVQGRPATGRKSQDVEKLKGAIAAAYERLAVSAPKTPELDSAGALVKKVQVEAIRNEVKRYGWLEIHEKTGWVTGTARSQFSRAKTDLIASGKYIEKDELFWRILGAAELKPDDPF